MRLIVTAFVYGEPKAQPRPRAFARNGRAGIYDPGTAEGWKGAIAAALHAHAGRLVTGALRVDLEFYFARPKSHFGTGRNANRLKLSAPIWHTKKPDIDNLEKAVFDALSEKSGIGLWKDDTQVLESRSKKLFADRSQAGMQIDIYAIENHGEEGSNE
jgi:Holliday junction resolvase RusA-like endonuclease